MLTFRQFKTFVFVLEGLNGLAAATYFCYMFFYFQERHQFSAGDNLLFSALNGVFYAVFAWLGGRAAQRRGALKMATFGFAIMMLGMFLASVSGKVWQQVACMILWTFGMCFTWPSLQALTSQGEPRPALARQIGMYNVIWAAGASIAYFTGGAVIEALGWKAMFLVPVGFHAVQLILIWGVAPKLPADLTVLKAPPEPEEEEHEERPPAAVARRFQWMAWVANPFAYIAMNTLLPQIPEVAKSLKLGPREAGFFCSIWMFVRLASFVILWKWKGWHYKRSWMFCAYGMLIVSFAGLLLVKNLPVLVLVQIMLGWSTGLIYYSSLFYSMDASDTQAESGGIHEAAIGIGNFAGPMLGWASLALFPSAGNASVYGVGALLAVGFVVVVRLLRVERAKVG